MAGGGRRVGGEIVRAQVHNTGTPREGRHFSRTPDGAKERGSEEQALGPGPRRPSAAPRRRRKQEPYAQERPARNMRITPPLTNRRSDAFSWLSYAAVNEATASLSGSDSIDTPSRKRLFESRKPPGPLRSV